MQKSDLPMRVACSTCFKVYCLAIYKLISQSCNIPGTFAETVSPEHQLHWIFENCKVVRSANGVSTIIEAMKIASSKHDLLWYTSCPIYSELVFLRPDPSNSSLSDQDAAHFHISPTEKADFIEEVLTEISVYLGMLYHLIEVFKGHDDFADELSKFVILYVCKFPKLCQ